MATTYSPNCRLRTPALNDPGWKDALDADRAFFDAVPAIGGLCVVPAETPSSTLGVQVSAGAYRKSDGTVGTYGGGAFSAPASATTYLWLTDAGVLTSGSAWPASSSAVVRLASIVAGTASVVVADSRVAATVTGSSPSPYLPLTGGIVGGPFTVEPAGGGVDTFAVVPSAGTVGFFGATPATQAATTATLTDSTGGVAGNAVSPAGAAYSEATANDNVASLTAKVNVLIAAMKRHGLMAP